VSDAEHSVEDSTIIEGLKKSKSGEMKKESINKVEKRSAEARASKKKTMQSKEL
jgi:hypothetical protein